MVCRRRKPAKQPTRVDRDGENHRPILVRRFRRHHRRHDSRFVSSGGCERASQSGADQVLSSHRVSSTERVAGHFLAKKNARTRLEMYMEHRIDLAKPVASKHIARAKNYLEGIQTIVSRPFSAATNTLTHGLNTFWLFSGYGYSSCRMFDRLRLLYHTSAMILHFGVAYETWGQTTLWGIKKTAPFLFSQ